MVAELPVHDLLRHGRSGGPKISELRALGASMGVPTSYCKEPLVRILKRRLI
jgi:hypothetical protein